MVDEAGEAIVDWEKFQQMRTELGASFVRILSYFREDGEKAVTKIEQAMHRGDAAALVLPAHTLKAEARQFGAERVGAAPKRSRGPAAAEDRGQLFRTTSCPGRAAPSALPADDRPARRRGQSFGQAPLAGRPRAQQSGVRAALALPVPNIPA